MMTLLFRSSLYHAHFRLCGLRSARRSEVLLDKLTPSIVSRLQRTSARLCGDQRDILRLGTKWPLRLVNRILASCHCLPLCIVEAECSGCVSIGTVRFPERLRSDGSSCDGIELDGSMARWLDGSMARWLVARWFVARWLVARWLVARWLDGSMARRSLGSPLVGSMAHWLVGSLARRSLARRSLARRRWLVARWARRSLDSRPAAAIAGVQEYRLALDPRCGRTED